MQQELVAVIPKYVKTAPSDIKLSIDRQDSFEVMEVESALPDEVG